MGAAERTKTGTAPSYYYGQIDSMLAAIPTANSMLACSVYTTTPYLASSETPLAVGACAIYRGRLWVVNSRQVTGASYTYNLTEAIPRGYTPPAPPEDAHYVEPSELVATQLVAETGLPLWDKATRADHIAFKPEGSAVTFLGYITGKRYTFNGGAAQSQLVSCYESARIEASRSAPGYALLDTTLARVVRSSAGEVSLESYVVEYALRNTWGEQTVTVRRSQVSSSRPAGSAMYVPRGTAIPVGSCVIHKGRIWEVTGISSTYEALNLKEVVSFVDIRDAVEIQYVSLRHFGIISLDRAKGWGVPQAAPQPRANRWLSSILRGHDAVAIAAANAQYSHPPLGKNIYWQQPGIPAVCIQPSTA
jgi:hypothetical protein